MVLGYEQRQLTVAVCEVLCKRAVSWFYGETAQLDPSSWLPSQRDGGEQCRTICCWLAASLDVGTRANNHTETSRPRLKSRRGGARILSRLDADVRRQTATSGFVLMLRFRFGDI